ncbi:NnrS family protein [Phaeovulum vinaykumarii]|uniref:NnrS family protein n=1 Tax=Phaeovulum vinaykumarii TaxID=407234 RepID=UPI000970D13B|nr:NnrS family protein [Phaeovulum vinaykumarii]
MRGKPPARRGFWAAPHRPLFTAAALWAILALVWWRWGPVAGLTQPAFATPGEWHAHEMYLGIGGAAMGGYFLTALTSWTGRAPLAGPGLMALAGLWLLARAAAAAAGVGLVPALWIAPVAPLYFVALAGVLLWHITAARAWHRLGFPAAVAGLALAQGLFLAATDGIGPWDSATLIRVFVMFYAIKVSIIAGGMIPAFGGNWLAQNRPDVPPPHDPPGRKWAGLAVLFSALGLTLAGQEGASALALIAAAAILAWRLSGWRLGAMRASALMLMLQAAFLWLVAGLCGVGLARLFPGLWTEADALHALAMGAMAGLVMALGARASARRDGGALRATPWLVAAVLALAAAAALRIAAPVLAREPMLEAATGIWVLGWAAFLVTWLPSLRGIPPRPVFSGPRA